MSDKTSEIYNGWKIHIEKNNDMCSNFSFDITDPDGRKQHVSLGGDTKERALERAREMIDMEEEFATEN